MQENNLLSIVIPTFNRADFLDYSLEIHIPIVQKYDIDILIFDNASTDNTQVVVQKWNKEYEHINYIRHKENIGAVKNFEYALTYPKSEYIWLLGDTYQFNIEILKSLLNIIKQYNDVIVFNLENKINFENTIYTEHNLLLNNLGALMTCAAVTVIHKSIFNQNSLNRYLNTNFPHTGLIFESLSRNENIKVNWIQEHSITSLKHPTIQKTNWSHTPKSFEIGCEDWTNFVMSLPPSYKLENKMKCIMDFGKVSGLLTFRNLILLRIKGLLNTEVFNKYKKLFPFTIDYPIWVIYMVTISPKSILGLLVKGYQKLKGKR